MGPSKTLPDKPVDPMATVVTALSSQGGAMREEDDLITFSLAPAALAKVVPPASASHDSHMTTAVPSNQYHSQVAHRGGPAGGRAWQLTTPQAPPSAGTTSQVGVVTTSGVGGVTIQPHPHQWETFSPPYSSSSSFSTAINLATTQSRTTPLATTPSLYPKLENTFPQPSSSSSSSSPDLNAPGGATRKLEGYKLSPTKYGMVKTGPGATSYATSGSQQSSSPSPVRPLSPILLPQSAAAMGRGGGGGGDLRQILMGKKFCLM